MLAKLDWQDIIAWLLFFVPGVLKGFQSAMGSGQKLDLMTILMILIPVLVGSFAVLKNPGSAAKTAALAPAAPPAAPAAAKVTALAAKKK